MKRCDAAARIVKINRIMAPPLPNVNKVSRLKVESMDISAIGWMVTAFCGARSCTRTEPMYVPLSSAAAAYYRGREALDEVRDHFGDFCATQRLSGLPIK